MFTCFSFPVPFRCHFKTSPIDVHLFFLPCSLSIPLQNESYTYSVVVFPCATSTPPQSKSHWYSLVFPSLYLLQSQNKALVIGTIRCWLYDWLSSSSSLLLLPSMILVRRVYILADDWKVLSYAMKFRPVSHPLYPFDNTSKQSLGNINHSFLQHRRQIKEKKRNWKKKEKKSPLLTVTH